MTLLYFIILLFIKFLLCSSLIFDIDIFMCKSMYMFAKRLIQYSSELGGSLYVSVVLRYSLSAKTPFMPGRGVDRGGDSTVEFFVVLPPYNRPGRAFVT